MKLQKFNAFYMSQCIADIEFVYLLIGYPRGKRKFCSACLLFKELPLQSGIN